MQHKRFGSSSAWKEVTIQQGPLRGSGAMARHSEMKPQAAACNGSARNRERWAPDPCLVDAGLWSIGKNKRKGVAGHNAVTSSLREQAGGYYSSSATESEENWLQHARKSADPRTIKLKHEEQSAEDQADSSVTAEAIAVESLLALDVLAHCALIQSQIYDSAASASSSPPPGRKVFVPSLGFPIFQRRRSSRPDDALLSKPSPIGSGSSEEENPGRVGRPKRKRAALLPSKFQDSVLTLKIKNKKSKKNSRNKKASSRRTRC